jgi:hypothetical protein
MLYLKRLNPASDEDLLPQQHISPPSRFACGLLRQFFKRKWLVGSLSFIRASLCAERTLGMLQLSTFN